MLACGGLDPAFQYAFDHDLMIRYLARFPRVRYLEDELAWFREHPESKSTAERPRFTAELAAIMDKLARELPQAADRRSCRMMAGRYRWRSRMEAISADFDRSGTARAVHVFREALDRPRERLGDRLTWRTIRRCAIGKLRNAEAHRASRGA
jgi:hypothetical protein